MFLYGLWLFADVRVAVAGGVLTAVLINVMWRPSGFGWRLDHWNANQIAAQDGGAVRWRWLLRAAIIAVLVFLVLFAALVLVGEAIG
jgi:hypothetical protein